MRQKLKETILPLLPESFARWYRAPQCPPDAQERFGHLTLLETFTTIYREQVWGRAPGQDFYSGTGSEDEFAIPYADALQRFLERHGIHTVTDLGCGDFRVGRRVSALVDQYHGVDCVPELIAHLSATEARPGVSFHCLDLTTSSLPPAGAALIRQVLQHLSNREIAMVLRQCADYPFIIVTEHLPVGYCPCPNLDQLHGPNPRLVAGSGVYLDQPPFSLKCSVLLELPCCHDSVIRTIVVDNRAGN
ncbi:class I SAM-dependent methyltransferase [Paludibaculum fermentans]|uniref:Class I SAM-dependent methyltransferase n=1 Tax=Paludibaculum fermentans TaxID=1473598 RepID=A0A7S7NNV8_PALFE|nr:class I SAM-dependent methyltransferase [Paludibaculum fermentans]QOY87061.1 class I SAM-dependent methyltransferase [Paludibaculum fermentans]